MSMFVFGLFQKLADVLMRKGVMEMPA